MRKWLLLSLVLAFVVIASIALADQKGSKMESEELRIIKGEVIDVSCYAEEGARGEGHKNCAVACIKAGQPGGILEESTGKVYVAAKEDHMTNPNTQLIPYAAKMVEVKGDVHERGGVATIDIKEIKELGGSAAITEKKSSGMMEEKSSPMEEKKGS